MKPLPLSKVRKWFFVFFVAGLLLLVAGICIGYVEIIVGLVVMIAGWLVLAGGTVFMLLFHRCPHCRGYLRFRSLYCPHCGHYLE